MSRYHRRQAPCLCRSLERRLEAPYFTVNAFALNEKERLLTSFRVLNFRKQGSSRRLDFPHPERFHENALQIIRGFSFSGQPWLELEAATFDAMKELCSFAEDLVTVLHQSSKWLLTFSLLLETRLGEAMLSSKPITIYK